MADGIYVSLDEAREELKKRWADVELRRRIEEKLGDRFLPPFKNAPRAVLNRQVASPDNGFVFFYQCAKYIGVEPLIWEDYEDIFVSLNEEKKGLGRLRVTLENGEKATVDVMDFHVNEKKKLSECVIKTGGRLIDFHKELFEHSPYKAERYVNPEWFKGLKDASHYYYLAFLHCVAHGVLFDYYFEDDDFTKNIVIPNIKKIEEDFGIRPIIIRLYPDNQTDEEDFYWWSYPSNINELIMKYAVDNKLSTNIL